MREAERYRLWYAMHFTSAALLSSTLGLACGAAGAAFVLAVALERFSLTIGIYEASAIVFTASAALSAYWIRTGQSHFVRSAVVMAACALLFTMFAGFTVLGGG